MTPRVTYAILLAALVPLSLAAAEESGHPGQPAAAAAKPVRVLVAYYTLRGNTERMAQAAAEGARAVQGTEVSLKKVLDVTKEDLVAADGIVLGGPTYYANIPGEMKVAIDDWSWKMQVDFTDKAGGAFATGGGLTGGKEYVVVSLLLFMLNNRMVIAGPLYTDEEGDDIWAEIGASAATGPSDPGLSDVELDAARRVGERVARVAQKMKW